ncbi:MAG: 4Fe-4S double cluster binding domain-containing protein [Dehalococcoidia bacterium]|jgi:epoxyqueuosine reductase
MEQMEEHIKDTALDMGYEACGIVRVSAISGFEQKLNERIERIPEANPFYQNFHRFAHPEATHPWAKSIIVCVRNHGKYKVPNNLEGLIGKSYLFDYRTDVLSKDYLNSLRFEAYLKDKGLDVATERRFGITALRWAASEAGLGLIRKNNFFYTKSGSWVSLEAWLIDRELESIEKPTIKPCPEGCTLCMKNCPTSSLSQPYTMNPSSCVSFLTTFGGSDSTKDMFGTKIGNWIYGCDVCQDVCPFNKNVRGAAEEFPGLTELSQHISLEKLVSADYSFLEKTVQPKFWYIRQNDLWKWKVNAINAMVNSYENKYRESIFDAQNDSQPNVREMAQWAIRRLGLQSVRIG